MKYLLYNLKLSNKNFIKGIVGLGLLLIILPVALAVIKVRTNIDPSADFMEVDSYLQLTPGNKIAFLNEKASVNVDLVTNRDPDYVVTGVDALVTYDPKMLKPVEIKPGLVFETLTKQNIDSQQGLIQITGLFSNVKDDAGMPRGYTGSSGTVATIVFQPLKTGQTELKFVHRGGQDTRDSNIVAFRKDQPVAKQVPTERFLKSPTTLQLSILEQEEPSPSPTSSPTPPTSGTICWNRVVVLESLPPKYVWMNGCKGNPDNAFISCTQAIVPLTEAEIEQYLAWVDSGRHSPDVCQRMSRSTVKPTSSPSPAPTPIFRPDAYLRIQLTLLGRESDVMIEKLDTPKIMPRNRDMTTTGTLYGVEAGQVKGVAVASLLGDLEEAEGMPLGRLPGSSRPTSVPNPTVPPQSKLVKLGEFGTNDRGLATVNIPQQYEGRRMYLFVQTPSHLRRAANRIVTLPQVPECSYTQPRCAMPAMIKIVQFENLLPGDIFIASGQSQQDNVINTFDTIELVKYLGTPIPFKLDGPDYQCFQEPCDPPRPSYIYHKADLNHDTIINTRDLKLLIDNLGKVGDEPTLSGSINNSDASGSYINNPNPGGDKPWTEGELQEAEGMPLGIPGKAR